MNYDTYYNLVKHPFIEDIFQKGLEITKEIKQNNGLKVNVVLSREPFEHEFYCLQLGYSLSHLLIVIQQLEHTIPYMSNFSPSKSMKMIGINRHSHLLWSLENYFIRTQTIYDRLLLLTDRLFHLQNQPNCISHESIVTNKHISKTEIPKLLKPVRNAIKKYYYDRNTIIHEASYMDDELRAIEAYSILSSDPNMHEFIKYELKISVKEYIKVKKAEFAQINKNICIALSYLFSKMHPIFKVKYSELSTK